MRRRLLTGMFVLLCCPCSMADEGLPAGLETTVSRGLTFLVSRQASDGSFGGDPSKVSTTSRALLSLLAAGNAPQTGQYSYSVRQAVEWLLSEQTNDGYFGSGDRSIRRQAIATMALAEAYGADTDPLRRGRVRVALQKAAGPIVAAHGVAKSNPNFAGGWNRLPNAPDGTLSVTTAVLLALRACQDVGVAVPAQVFAASGEFVLRCYDGQSGGFGPAPSTPAQAPSTAAALVCLHLLDLAGRHAPEIDVAVKYLGGHPIDAAAPIGYASINIVTLCTYELSGRASSSAGQQMLARLMRLQEKDGGWPQSPPGARGRAPLDRIAATAAALQTLTIPYQLLPIYQR